MDKTTQKDSQAAAFEQYRTLLFSIAYRMIGSASDAEDLVQETYLRYQASEGSEIVSLKAYLTTIITHLALDYLKSAHVTREQYVGTWLPEPILTSDEGEFPLAKVEQQESLSMAFMRLLETLSPPERAVFLLHEVFDYPFSEIGMMLEKSAANCRQIYHRATLALQEQRVRFESDPQRQRQLLFSFLSATEAGNMEALTSLLAQDAVSWADSGGKAKANLKPIYGQLAVARFWFNVAQKGRRPGLFTLAEINGGPAFLFWEEGRLAGVGILTLSDGDIQEIYALVNPDKLTYLQKQLSERGITAETSEPISFSPDQLYK
ncbi:MAG TPA: RNA polymerase sigma-70 factor [Ktedonobacteraceae bacterium]|nr:RNA polymerase sigma-70 factor [Ktedonobacteraceae bacterium]